MAVGELRFAASLRCLRVIPCVAPSPRFVSTVWRDENQPSAKQILHNSIADNDLQTTFQFASCAFLEGDIMPASVTT
ncbi:MAG: hypothetical protein DCC65_02405 [Planctomycetota bacterium]|nr:MAG: hypothetical protein DCC65_02405 [Planctomycetota bacterium]